MGPYAAPRTLQRLLARGRACNSSCPTPLGCDGAAGARVVVLDTPPGGTVGPLDGPVFGFGAAYRVGFTNSASALKLPTRTHG